ncbi:MAG: hypothetical protein NC338_00250 [Firmicutes bacterium]|nr:hypothetical protein [Bacillota bacterium]
MAQGNSTSGFFSKLASTIKSAAKIMLQSRPVRIRQVARPGEILVVMGNGPSLNTTMANHADALKANRLMAVNFAANAPQFYNLRPDFYIMADPVFFTDLTNANVKKLWDNFVGQIDWNMTLFIPSKSKLPVALPANITVNRFNPVGVEGFAWMENAAFSAGLGMPRPRNVLIPAIMIAIMSGFKKIYIVGADHSWSKTLEVTEDNVVVSIQPHFYEDNEAEHSRVASVYKNIRLHQIMYSFYVAFRSYFTIASYASHRGVEIYNATPGSFIDAFVRKPLPD